MDSLRTSPGLASSESVPTATDEFRCDVSMANNMPRMINHTSLTSLARAMK
jgi:hypothetical protein